MLRYILTALCVLALATPVFGYDVTWDGDPEGDIDINLQIDCYIQIDRQDSEIHFSDGTVVGEEDWWMTSLQPVGTVQCPDDDNQHPMYPWAGDQWYAGAGGRFYESYDGATIFIHSNNDLTMTVHTNGDLAGTVNDPLNKIPTWFTLGLCPFMINSAWITGHNIPLCGNPGCYASDVDADFAMEVCTGPDHPGQFVFPCAGNNTYTLDLDAETQGTLKFLSRIERHGMADPGDHYYTWLDVDFTSP